MADQGNHVNLFIPCEMDMFSPSVAQSVVRLLEKLGLEVHYNADQTCCGRNFYFSGEIETAKELGAKMMLNTRTPNSPWSSPPLLVPALSASITVSC